MYTHTCTHIPIYELYFVRYARKDVSYALSKHCSALLYMPPTGI